MPSEVSVPTPSATRPSTSFAARPLMSSGARHSKQPPAAHHTYVELTWELLTGQRSLLTTPASTGSPTPADAIALFARNVCIRTSPSRAHGQPAGTAARRLSTGERRERVPAQSVNAQDRDVNAVVHGVCTACSGAPRRVILIVRPTGHA